MPADTAPTQAAAAPAPGADTQNEGGSRLRAVLGRWETLLIGLLLVTAVFGTSLSGEFLTADSFTTGSLDLSEVALMALALTLVIIAAEIDLSFAAVYGLDEVMPLGIAFLVVGAVDAVAAAVLFMQGRKKLRTVEPVPQTKATIQEDVEWAKQQRT